MGHNLVERSTGQRARLVIAIATVVTIGAMLIIGVVAPAVSVADDLDTDALAAPASTPTPTPVPPTPTPTPPPPTPTPIPPTPTQVPPTPTATSVPPTPTDVPPTATESPSLTGEGSSEPTATATVITGTDTGSESETPESTATATPNGTTTPEATATPTPTPNELTCAVPGSTEIDPGGFADLDCVYQINDAGQRASVTARFQSVPGKGWELEIGQVSGGDIVWSPRGETSTWQTQAPLAEGERVDLVVRVHVPLNAEPAQQATITIAADGSDAPATIWTVTVAEPMMSALQSDGFGIQSVTEAPECIESLSVAADGYVRFTCDPIQGEANTEYDVVVSALTEGWEYRYDSNQATDWTSSINDVLDTFTEQQSQTFTLDLRPTAENSTYVGEATVTVAETDDSGTPLSFTLSAEDSEAAPGAGDFSFTCSPEAVTEVVDVPVTVTCTYSALASLGSRTVQLTSISVPAPPGWTIASDVGTGAGTGTTLAISPTNTTISTTEGDSYQFSFTLTPSCEAETTTATMNLTSAFDFGTTTGITGPGEPVNLARLAGVIAGNFTGTDPASFDAATVTGLVGDTVTGAVALNIDRAACSAGSVRVHVDSASTTHFDTTDGQANTIPLSSLTVTSSSVGAGDDEFIAEVTPGGSITTAADVASISASNTASAYTLNLGLSLDVPSGTATGTYTATLSVDFMNTDGP